jgi:predicted alpha/beta-hydrolase family hydrolase
MQQIHVEGTSTEPAVRGFLHHADGSSVGLVLTHGAGSNCNSPLLIALAEALCGSGITVLRCDLPFRQTRPHGPPLGTAEKDQQGIRAASQYLRTVVGGRIFVGGHSYGGRMATVLASEEPSFADGLLLLSYPLHPPRKPQQLRTAHFPKLQKPSLFVHGARDPFGSIEEMETALKLIPAPTRILPIEGAGHELLGKARPADVTQKIATAFTEWTAFVCQYRSTIPNH